MNQRLAKQQGFTLIELGVVLAIMIILLTLSVVSITTVQQQAYLSKSLEVLLSDIKLQQTKAMNGQTDGESTTYRYGIYFDTDTYTLFRGDTYNSSDPFNFTVSLDGQLTFSSVTFPNSQIVFEKGSGELVGFTPGSNTITLSEDPTTITVNQLGVITNVE